MIFYPAIDLKDGKCVRLVKGKMTEAKVFNDSPADQAKVFQDSGCEWLHLVDLNGAFEGRLVNSTAVKEILKNSSIPIQLGGGIRNIKTVEAWLTSGISRIILGTVAVTEPDLVRAAAKEFPGRIVVGIDARNGYVATNGWDKTTAISAKDLAIRYEDTGISAIIFTDIDCDGTMAGPSIKQTEAISKCVKIPIIASGGIASLDDLTKLKNCDAKLNGVICGRAIYENAINLETAVQVLKE